MMTSKNCKRENECVSILRDVCLSKFFSSLQVNVSNESICLEWDKNGTELFQEREGYVDFENLFLEDKNNKKDDEQVVINLISSVN